MWKRFTEAFCALALLVLAGGCASGGRVDDERSVFRSNDDRLEVAAAGVSAQEPPAVSSAVASIWNEAVTAMQRGELEAAEALLREITERQPELAGPWINLGQIHVLKGARESARRAFEQAVLANPSSCAAHNQLGVLSRQAGEFEAAEDHYRSCIDRVPDYGDAYLNLGILYELYLGRLDDALIAYRRYQSLRGEPDRQVAVWVADLERRLGV